MFPKQLIDYFFQVPAKSVSTASVRLSQPAQPTPIAVMARLKKNQLEFRHPKFQKKLQLNVQCILFSMLIK